jgi:SAM-dependent methyltransferase
MFHPQGPTFGELARQALSSTQRGYDLLAPKFDFTPFRTPDSILAAAAAEIGEPGCVGDGLDIGCGTGAATRMLRPLCRRRVVGIDFSRGMLDVARQHIPEMPGSAPVELIQADCLDMPFREEFDLAVSFGAIGHLRPCEQPVLVDQVARALRPGGRFVFASSYLPRRISLSYWMSRTFNAAMHVRNWLVHPPFIMFYLTFLVPDAKRLLVERGFAVEVRERIFAPPFQSACLVLATRLPEAEGPPRSTADRERQRFSDTL